MSAASRPTVARLHMTLSEQEELEAVETEIRAQHYFKSMIDELRSNPTDTVLSDLVNKPKADGSLTSDGQLLTHLLDDIFWPASRRAVTSLRRAPSCCASTRDIQRTVRADPDKHMRRFVEEALRIESPVQGIVSADEPRRHPAGRRHSARRDGCRALRRGKPRPAQASGS